MLLKAGYDPNIPMGGVPLLCHCARGGLVECVRVLLDYGATIDTLDAVSHRSIHLLLPACASAERAPPTPASPRRTAAPPSASRSP